MSYRIFVTVRRGTMDATAVCVYPWELPLLEEIHGGNAEQKTMDEMCDLKGAARVEMIKLPYAANGSLPGMKMREQLEVMSRVDQDSDPVASPDGEWARLCEKYGMHQRVAMPVCEKVYGSPANFRRILKSFKGSEPPADLEDVIPELEQPAAAAEEKPISEMGRTELLALLKREGIAFGKNDGISKLRDLAVMAAA